MLEMQNTGEIGKRNQVYQVIEYVFFVFGIPALCVLLCKMNDSHVFNFILYGIEGAQKEVERLSAEAIDSLRKLGGADTFLEALLVYLIHRKK